MAQMQPLSVRFTEGEIVRLEALTNPNLRSAGQVVRQLVREKLAEVVPVEPALLPVEHLHAHTPSAVVREAMRDYLANKPVAEIAAEAKVTIGCITHWAQKLGLPKRSRGRRHLLKPSNRDQKILEMSRRGLTLGEIALLQNVSKQAVFRVLRRWEHWKH